MAIIHNSFIFTVFNVIISYSLSDERYKMVEEVGSVNLALVTISLHLAGTR